MKIISYTSKPVKWRREPENIIEYPIEFDRRLVINLGIWRREWKWRKRVV
jgi:hypothetical protein